jgi:hypothetical protein
LPGIFLQEDDEQTRGFLFVLKMRGLRLKKKKNPDRSQVRTNSKMPRRSEAFCCKSKFAD